MLLSGSKSYYDGYLRKKDTSRTLHDPPSLLTDRGAYVNFLEVQLERVSAACLGVQAYDQRFNDMQQQIISLEEKHMTSTRLLALNQQCTEELRKIFDEKILRVTEEMRSENWNIRQLLEEISSRIGGIEYILSEKVPMIQREVNEFRVDLEQNKREIGHVQQTLQTNAEESLLEIQKIHEISTSLMKSISQLETADSKLQFEVEEMGTKFRQTIQTTEKRFQESLQEHHDLQSRNIHSFNVKFLEQIDKVQMDVISREAGCLAANRLLGDNLREDLKRIQSEFNEEMGQMEKRWTEGFENEMEKIRNRFMEHIVILSSGLDTQRVAQQSSTDNSKIQFKQLDRVISTMSTDQNELLRTTSELKHSIDRCFESSSPTNTSHQNSPRDHPEPQQPHPQPQSQHQHHQQQQQQQQQQQHQQQQQQRSQSSFNRFPSQGSSRHDNLEHIERQNPREQYIWEHHSEEEKKEGPQRIQNKRSLQEENNSNHEQDQAQNQEQHQHFISGQNRIDNRAGSVPSGRENIPPNPMNRHDIEKISSATEDESSLSRNEYSNAPPPPPPLPPPPLSSSSQRQANQFNRGGMKYSISTSWRGEEETSESQQTGSSHRQPSFDESPIQIPKSLSAHSLHRGKLKTPVTISRSPEKEIHGGDETEPSKEEYIDYLGGGIYSDGGVNQEEVSQRRAAALGLTYIGSGLYVDPQGAAASTGKEIRPPSDNKPRKQSPNRRAPLPPSSTAPKSGTSSSTGGPSSPAVDQRGASHHPPEQIIAIFEKFLSKYRSEQDSVDEQQQHQQESLHSNSLSWSDFLEESLQSEPSLRFQQQQQYLPPWRPTSQLAQPMSSEHTRPPLSPMPLPDRLTPPLVDDSSTITTATTREASRKKITTIGTGTGTGTGGGGHVDKIAPERRHFHLPSNNLVGSSALMK